MRTKHSARSMFAASALGLTMVAYTPAMAQNRATTEADQAEGAARGESAIDILNDTIVVTATKKATVENVQAVPLAVTAFNSGTLDALKVREIQSLTYSAPNVSLDQIGTTRGVANFSIRGLGVNSSIPSIDPTVGVFVDGVYLGLNFGVVFDIFDVDSVEILRGPQGILFGRNTTGGAVLINTGNPTRDFRLKFKGSVDGPVDGGRGAPNMTMSGVFSGPLVADSLLFKIAAYHNSDGGYFRNLFDGRDFGKAETTILRGALEWHPSSRLKLVGKYDWFDSSGDGPAGQNHGIFERDTFDFSVDTGGRYTAKTQTATLRADYELDNGVITNIFGYRKYAGTGFGDIDATPVFLFNSDTETKQDQISNELRYAGKFGNVDLTVGAFYFTQEGA